MAQSMGLSAIYNVIWGGGGQKVDFFALYDNVNDVRLKEL